MFGKLGNHHKDWKIAKFENFCEINPNKKSIENIEDSTEVSFIPMAAVSEKGEIDTSETKTYSEVKKGFTSFSDKDVLFAKITPCMENGKGAVAEGLKNNLGFGSTEFHVLRPKQELCDSYWLYYLMSLPEFRKKAELNMKGSAGQKRVPANFLAKFEISLPPIGLQKVYIDFFNQIDKSKFLLQQILEKFELLKKSRFIEMFGQCNKEELIGNVVSICRGASPRPISEYITKDSEGINWIKIGDVSDDSLYITSAEEKITKEGASKSRLVHKGDFILSNSMSFGRPYILGIDGCVHDGWLILSKFSETFNEIFLYYALKSDYVQNQFRMKVNGATVKNLNSDLVKNTKIKVPPIEKQMEFSNFIEQIDKSKFNVFQDQTAAQVKVIVVLHHIC